MTPPPACDPRAAAAYEWAAGLIVLARRKVAEGIDVDLAPIRPAIRDLCDVVKALPPAESEIWLAQLVDLQRELAALGHDLAKRNPGQPDTRHEGEHDPCR